MKSDKEYLRHINDEILYITRTIFHLSYDDFFENETLKRAIVRSLEIIGEASKKISNDYKSQYPGIEWRAIAGTRDKLIHDYIGVDYELVWDIITNKIPELKNMLSS